MPRTLAALLALAILAAAPAFAGEVSQRLPFLPRDGARRARRVVPLPWLPQREVSAITEDDVVPDVRSRVREALYPNVRPLLELLPDVTRDGPAKVVWESDAAGAERAASLFGAVERGFARRVRLEVAVLDRPTGRAPEPSVVLGAEKPRLRLRREVAEGALYETSTGEEATYPYGLQTDTGGAAASMVRLSLGPRLAVSVAPAGPDRWIVRLTYHDARVVETHAFGAGEPSAVAPEVAVISFAAEIPAASGRGERVVARTGDAAVSLVLAIRVTPLGKRTAGERTRIHRVDATYPLLDEGGSLAVGGAVSGEEHDGIDPKRLRIRTVMPDEWATESLTLHTVRPGLVVAEGAAAALDAFDARVARWWLEHTRAAVLDVVTRDGEGRVVRSLEAPLVPGRPFRLLQGRLHPVAKPKPAAGGGGVSVGARVEFVLTGRVVETSGERLPLEVREMTAGIDPQTGGRTIPSTARGEKKRRQAAFSAALVRRRDWSAAIGDREPADVAQSTARHAARLAPWKEPR